MWPRTLCGFPTMVSQKDEVLLEPKQVIGLPKPILNAHSAHATMTTAKPMKVSIMLLTDQRSA